MEFQTQFPFWNHPNFELSSKYNSGLAIVGCYVIPHSLHHALRTNGLHIDVLASDVRSARAVARDSEDIGPGI